MWMFDSEFFNHYLELIESLILVEEGRIAHILFDSDISEQIWIKIWNQTRKPTWNNSKEIQYKYFMDSIQKQSNKLKNWKLCCKVKESKCIQSEKQQEYRIHNLSLIHLKVALNSQIMHVIVAKKALGPEKKRFQT